MYFEILIKLNFENKFIFSFISYKLETIKKGHVFIMNKGCNVKESNSIKGI